MTAADWIAKRERLGEAATEGPWRRVTEPGTKNHALHDARDADIATDYEGVWYNKGDAEFIADARTALPKALAALEAVLALHQPVKIYAQADECGCGDEDHTIIESPQGDDLCWDTPTGELCCPECLDEDSGAIDYPCPTVAEIAEALGVEP